MVIVDTTVWIDFLAGTENPQTIWLDRQLGMQRIGLTDLILCEILQGIRSDSTFLQTRDELLKYEVFDTGGAHLALAAARNYRRLHAKGITIRKTIDCLIATFCLDQGYSLLHRDRDFDAFEVQLGLRIVRP